MDYWGYLAAPDCLPIPGVTVPFTDVHGIPVLVILMALTAFVQQWISPRNTDPSQQKMMMYMPIVVLPLSLGSIRARESTGSGATLSSGARTLSR